MKKLAMILALVLALCFATSAMAADFGSEMLVFSSDQVGSGSYNIIV